MNLAETLAALQDAGTAQNRQVYARHGAKEPMFGVSWAALRDLARSIKTDDALAEVLWDTGNYDARLLAVLLADPERVDAPRAERWLGDVDNYVVCEALARLVARSPAAQRCAESWRRRSDQWGSSAGWCVTSSLALDPRSGVDDAAGLALIDTIQKTIAQAPNRTRHEMNMALISLGGRSPKLRQAALAAAAAIGPVVVDHGETGCKTPEVAPYIESMWARKAKAAPAAKAAKPRAAKATKAAKAAKAAKPRAAKAAKAAKAKVARPKARSKAPPPAARKAGKATKAKTRGSRGR